MKRIGVIGASASGLYASIFLALKHPDYRIDVYDRMDAPGKKLRATGNGHCNLLNLGMRADHFNHPKAVEPLLRRYPVSALMDTIKNLGIPLVCHGELVYPLSYSAPGFVAYLFSLAKRLGIVFHFSTRIVGVEGTTLAFEGGEKETFDDVIFAFGGKSQANLGSDGSLFSLLEKEGYSFILLSPRLCPIKSKDVPKSLFGTRHEALVRIIRDDKEAFSERGEVMFKKDGLSGIVIMNATRYLEFKDKIVLDLFPEWTVEDLAAAMAISYEKNPELFLAGMVEKPLADYVLNHPKLTGFAKKNKLKPADFPSMAELLKSLQFGFDGFYDFDSSQVTRGGISLENLDATLRSKINPHHHFIGECVDIDGPCGGYNLGWALLSALTVSENL